LYEHLDGMAELKKLAMNLMASSPPCDESGEMAARLLSYCEERRKKALRQHLLERMKESSEDDDQITLLNKLKELF